MSWPPILSRRAAVAGIACLATASAAAALTPRKREAANPNVRLDNIVPIEAGGWQQSANSEFVLPQEGEPTSFYDQVLTRTYSAANAPQVMLVIAYGEAQSGLMKVHRPEVCYTSAGFSIHRDAYVSFPIAVGASVPGRSFLAIREDRTEQVFYWTRVSRDFPEDLNSQRLVMLELGLKGVIPDGALVRFSTMGVPEGVARSSVFDLAEALIGRCDAAGRALFLGRTTTV